MRFIRMFAVFAAVLLVSRVALSGEKAPSPLDPLKALEGTWEKTGPDGKPTTIVFHNTAAGSVVVETMFPGSKFEMVNTYHMDGDNLMMTHYCAQGVQPRLKLVKHEGNAWTFEFQDCTNLKEGASCMGGLELIIDGDKLTEKWSYRTDGKLGKAETFEFQRKK